MYYILKIQRNKCQHRKLHKSIEKQNEVRFPSLYAYVPIYAVVEAFLKLYFGGNYNQCFER